METHKLRFLFLNGTLKIIFFMPSLICNHLNEIRTIITNIGRAKKCQIIISPDTPDNREWTGLPAKEKN